jgi:predicted Zn finger-like uncharacterized protein
VQITCDKCQTSYLVEDKLIPPSGVPVQCTKCGNVFTAFPQQAARAPSKTVMMFSTDTPAAEATRGAPAQTAAPSAAPSPRSVSGPAVAPPASIPAGERPTWPKVPAPVAAPSPRVSKTDLPVPAAATPSVDEASPFDFPPAPQPTAQRRPINPPQEGAAVAAPRPSESGAHPAPATGGMDPVPPPHAGRVTQMFFNQGAELDQRHQSAAGQAPAETQRRPGQTMMFMQAADFEQKLMRKSRAPMVLALVALGVLILALAGVFLWSELMGPAGSDRQAVRDHARAVELLRRDDPQSLQAAEKLLSEVLARKPVYIDAEGDSGLVLNFLAQQKRLQVERLQASIDALNRQVGGLTQRNEPRDAALAAQKKVWTEYEPLARDEKAMEQQALALINKAGKEDARNAAVIRARAFIAADQDNPDGVTRYQKAYLKEIGKSKDGWSELMLAELATAGKPSEEKRAEGKKHAAEALAIDPGLVRARYLVARLDAEAKDEAALKDSVAALTAANPQHTEGAGLLAALQENLAREKTEKEERAARQAAAAKAAQPPASAKPASRRAHSKHR